MPERFSPTQPHARPKPTDRLFFAVFPDAAAAARIARLAQDLRSELGLKGNPRGTERFHVTLQYLGDYAGLQPDIVAAAAGAAATVEVPPFDVAFDRVRSFAARPRNRPVVLCAGEGVTALSAFRQILVAATDKIGLGREAQPPYTPHVTLLYDDHLVPERPIEPVGWTVREFVLVHSLLGRAVHVPLARWPLQSPFTAS
jgi:2'-5' RNA ligase